MNDMHPDLWAILSPLDADQAHRVAVQMGHLQGGNALFGGDLADLAVHLRRTATHRAATVDGPVWNAIATLHERWRDETEIRYR